MQVISPDIFREYDIRGLAETELTSEAVRAIGWACGRYFKAHGSTRCLVGRDNRLSSDRIFKALVRGLALTGIEVLDIGTVTTPIFYFAGVHWGIEAGIMITASHNPAEYNGFKIMLGTGTLYGEAIQEIYRLCRSVEEREIPGEMEVVCGDPTDAYKRMLTDKVRLGARPLHAVIDCGNGTAGLFAQEIFEALGCRITPLYCRSDGRFPHHHPDPVRSANLRELQAAVVDSGADLGIGFDGDGDRLGVVDEKGSILWGDRLMMVFWREILPKNPGTPCIIEVKCSQALVEEVERLGGRPLFFRTGHSLIKAKMRELGALFTGEMSGHMFFADEYYGFDDAFYAAARLLRILSHQDRSLSQLLADAPRYPSTAETHVDCDDQNKFHVVRELLERFRRRYPVIDIDGVRVLFPGGWALARPSNTQPAIVARCEGRTHEELSLICAEMKEALESFPEVRPFTWEY